MPAFNDINFIFRCSCPRDIIGAQAFLMHMRVINHPAPFQCGYCDSNYIHLNSLMRHTRDAHYDYHENVEMEGVQVQGDVAEAGAGGAVIHVEGVAGGGVPHGEGIAGEVEAGLDENVEPGIAREPEEEIDLTKSAATMVLNLRQTGAVTSSSIERFQAECMTMVSDVTTLLKQKVQVFFEEEGLNNPRAQEFLNSFLVEDPFKHLKTLKQQLNYFASKMGLVIPESIFLDFRIDYLLNPVSGQYEPVQVPMSFQYVPVLKTLKLLMSNPKICELINAEKVSEDGVLRSFLDGSRARIHPLISRYPNIIRIQLYWDDLEVVNPLGSKTTIHKLAAFYFSLQNLPAVEVSQLSSIYLLVLAYSEDLKIPNGIEKVLAPFLADMRRLESDRGVEVVVNDERICLRATLCCLCADALAAHYILGFLGPGARHFCRKCMISRQELLRDCRTLGPLRTKDQFVAQAAQVQVNPRLATDFGVKKDCPLHVLNSFSATDDAVFDIFHEMLEGVCHWIIILTLKSFVEKDYITLVDFNSRLTAFNYGVTDVKNKPSANISSLKGKKLKQTGSQTWCLMRVFGFLVPEVPENDINLKMLNLLQEIMLILFAGEVRLEDIDRMDELVRQHHDMFQALFVDGEEQQQDSASEDEDDPAEVVPGVVVPDAQVNKERPRNKLHDMLHVAAQMREHGPLYRYWCARYEGRHHLFVKFGNICGNFMNLPKTMAQMHQISTLSGLLKTSQRSEDIEPQSVQDILVELCEHSQLLTDFGLDPAAVVGSTKSVLIAGEVYRPGLFVLVDTATPVFSLIQNVYLCENQVIFIVADWNTLGFVKRFCAYKVNRPIRSASRVTTHKLLARHGAFAPWNPWNQRVTYIAPRSIIF